MRKCLISLLLLMICVYTVLPVSAESGNVDAIDWENVDWPSFDWNLLNDETVDASFSVWIEEKAELNELFCILYHSDGAAAASVSYILDGDFFGDPLGFVRALAQESEEIQQKIISYFPLYLYHGRGHDFFPDVVYAIELAEDDTPETQYVLACFEAAVAEYWGIGNPKTGDGLTLVAAMLIFSAAGMALLVVPKKSGR